MYKRPRLAYNAADCSQGNAGPLPSFLDPLGGPDAKRQVWGCSEVHRFSTREGAVLNSETLEVAISMSFLFLFVSLICTAIKEWLEGIFKWRAMDLERALRVLLADPDGTLT